MKKGNKIEKFVVASRMQTPDGTILWSRSVHDYVTYEDAKTGEVYMLDGGSDYRKTSVNKVPGKNISIYSTSKWKTLRDFVIRYTVLLDENGMQTNKTGYVRVSNMSDAHLKALYEFVEFKPGGKKLCGWIKKEIQYRSKNKISIPEHDYSDELVEAIQKPC